MSTISQDDADSHDAASDHASAATGEVEMSDIRLGYPLEVPRVILPWGTDEAGIRALLPGVREVAIGYLVADVVSIGGLRHSLGLYFEPKVGGRLVELELFGVRGRSETSFRRTQTHLEAAFGPPDTSDTTDMAGPLHAWAIDGVTIRHYLIDRFGPEEHLRIRMNRRP